MFQNLAIWSIQNNDASERLEKKEIFIFAVT